MSYVKRRVNKVHTAKHNNLLRLTFANGTEIITTDDHPFLTPNGWKSFNPEKTKGYKRYSEVTQYQEGEGFHFYDSSSTNYFKLLSITKLEVPMVTYTLELDGEGAFIANGILVGQE